MDASKANFVVNGSVVCCLVAIRSAFSFTCSGGCSSLFAAAIGG